MQKNHDCVEVVENKRQDIGMTIRALSRKSGVPEKALYGILSGKRKMTAQELLAVSSVLDLNISDFKTA